MGCRSVMCGDCGSGQAPAWYDPNSQLPDGLRRRVLSKQHHSTLSKNLIRQFRNTLYLVQTRTLRLGLRGAQVPLCEAPDGGVRVLYKGQEIPCRVYDKGQALPVVADPKQAAARMNHAMRRQPAPQHPWKRCKPDYLGTDSPRKTGHFCFEFDGP